MPLPQPILDKRSYKQLRDELVKRIPVYTPEWTDFNESDSGITLVELFEFLGETLIWQIDERQRRRHRRRLALLIVGMAGLGALCWTSKLSCSRDRNPGESWPPQDPVPDE